MTTRFVDQSDVEPGDEPVVEGAGRSTWTFFRLLGDLAIIMVAVPVGLNILEPKDRLPGSCGNTLDNGSLIFGLFLWFVIQIPKILKALNDPDEHAVARHFPTDKPEPLDDF